MPRHVTIIGAGEIGSAIASLIKAPGVQIERWDKDTSKVPKQKSLDAAVTGADVVFLCIPSWHLREGVAEIRTFLRKKTIVVFLSKGIELGTKFTVDALAATTLPRGQAFALLSGPMLAEELVEGLPSCAVVATKNKQAFHRVAALFSRSALKLVWSTDMRGVAFAGVLKNAYALALGIADAIPMGSNAKGWMVQTAVREMTQIIGALNRQGDAQASATGPAGLGDLVATGFSPYSSNFTVGRELVAGKGITKMSEGFISLPSLCALLGQKLNTTPLLKTVAAIVMKKKNAKKAFEQFVKGTY
jgi:glycerol-3-phosphate dehydrogenase (NAD(P)+)